MLCALVPLKTEGTAYTCKLGSEPCTKGNFLTSCSQDYVSRSQVYKRCSTHSCEPGNAVREFLGLCCGLSSRCQNGKDTDLSLHNCAVPRTRARLRGCLFVGGD
jgi:hypothetical protein